MPRRDRLRGRWVCPPRNPRETHQPRIPPFGSRWNRTPAVRPVGPRAPRTDVPWAGSGGGPTARSEGRRSRARPGPRPPSRGPSVPDPGRRYLLETRDDRPPRGLETLVAAPVAHQPVGEVEEPPGASYVRGARPHLAVLRGAEDDLDDPTVLGQLSVAEGAPLRLGPPNPAHQLVEGPFGAGPAGEGGHHRRGPREPGRTSRGGHAGLTRSDVNRLGQRPLTGPLTSPIRVPPP